MQEIQPPVDAAILMTSPAVTNTVVRDCLEAGIRRVWMYGAGVQGAVSLEAVEFCHFRGCKWWLHIVRSCSGATPIWATGCMVSYSRLPVVTASSGEGGRVGSVRTYARFAVSVCKSAEGRERPCPASGNDTILRVYAPYPQANPGDATGEQPSSFDFVRRAKVDAWSAMTPEGALKQYVDLVAALRR